MIDSCAEVKKELELFKKEYEKDKKEYEKDKKEYAEAKNDFKVETIIPMIRNVVGELLLFWIGNQHQSRERATHYEKNKSKTIDEKIQSLADQLCWTKNDLQLKADVMINKRHSSVHFQKKKDLQLKVEKALKYFKQYRITDMDEERQILKQFNFMESRM